MKSVPQLCGNRLVYVTNLSKVILWPVLVKVYKSPDKPEKLEKTKLWITTENKKNDKSHCVEESHYS